MSIGLISNIIVTENFISFSIELNGNCNDSIEADQDQNYTPSPYTYVPDDNFEQSLIDLGYDDVLDDYVLTSNISQLDLIRLGSKNISDLRGIEDFISLTELSVFENDIRFVDLSKNTLLETLSISKNALSSLDISNNNLLKELYISSNQISELDLSYNKQLEALYAERNLLTRLDLSNNTKLKHKFRL